MARGINKVILIGNLGNDPETRYAPSGDAITNVSLATSEAWTDKATGERQERTEWHRVVFFKRQAEVVAEYCKKGSKLYVEGQLRTRKWQDQNGQDRYTTEIVAREVHFLGGNPEGGTGGTGGNQGGGRSNYAPSQGQRAAAAPPPPPQGGFDDFDDDIPF